MRTSKLFTATVFISAVTLLSAGLAVAAPPQSPGSNGNGPVARATGSGYWTNGQGIDFYAEFNAHEGRTDSDAKGDLLQKRVDGVLGGFVVEVDAVTVYETHACFGGTTTDAWGTYESKAGQYRWTMVSDGGEGLGAEDYLRGSWQDAEPGFCTAGDAGSNEPWSAGNVQVHPAGS